MITDIRAIGTPVTASSAIDDCWNRIGVQGNRSCPELERYVHCHNCPVYSAAARTLLDRNVQTAYIADRTSHFAKPEQRAEQGSLSIMIFRVGAEWLALRASVVAEVTEVRPIHSLPHRRSGAVLGIANVRGELVACMSLSIVLGIDAVADDAREVRRLAHPRLLVVRRGAVRAACPVDEVHGMDRIHPRELQVVPATVANKSAAHSEAVVSWKGRSIGLLDDGRLFATFEQSLA